MLTCWRSNLGVWSALGAALLFGAGTPFAKLLLGPVSPWLLAGLLYLGSGIGLAIWRFASRTKSTRLPASAALWLLGAVVSGGMMAPALLMWGLANMPASGASLLLNAEGVLTALIAWVVFHENFDRRIALGMALIVVGTLVLSWPGEMSFGAAVPSLAVLGACFFWAIDNNLTRKVALLEASYIAMIKGLVAGIVNTGIALALGAELPSLSTAVAAAIVGLMSYGVSLMLFVIALRHLGTARTAAYFSTAPFAGAVIAILWLGEPLTAGLIIAGSLMAAGVLLHISESHSHVHAHVPLEHEHEHDHDAHHLHTHSTPLQANVAHSHLHQHEPLSHDHAHYPDAHHQHRSEH